MLEASGYGITGSGPAATTQWEPEPMVRTGLTEPDCKSWTSNRFEPSVCPSMEFVLSHRRQHLHLASLFYPLNKRLLMACEEPDTVQCTVRGFYFH